MNITITRCTKADFDTILGDVAQFWGEEKADLVRPLHHPMFIHEFGDTCFVARQAGRVVGYLFGFLSQTEPTGYVHLTAVRADSRNEGVGAKLHSAFVEKAKAMGCRHVKAITSADNGRSIAFHKKMGMAPLGEPGPGGIPVVKDYSGPGKDRVVLWKDV